jgi:hypothetical protein
LKIINVAGKSSTTASILEKQRLKYEQNEDELPQIDGFIEDEQTPSLAIDTWSKKSDPSNLVVTTIQGKASAASKTIGFYSAPAKDVLKLKNKSSKRTYTKRKRTKKSIVIKCSDKGKFASPTVTV